MANMLKNWLGVGSVTATASVVGTPTTGAVVTALEIPVTSKKIGTYKETLKNKQKNQYLQGKSPRLGPPNSMTSFSVPVSSRFISYSSMSFCAMTCTTSSRNAVTSATTTAVATSTALPPDTITSSLHACSPRFLFRLLEKCRLYGPTERIKLHIIKTIAGHRHRGN